MQSRTRDWPARVSQRLVRLSGDRRDAARRGLGQSKARHRRSPKLASTSQGPRRAGYYEENGKDEGRSILILSCILGKRGSCITTERWSRTSSPSLICRYLCNSTVSLIKAERDGIWCTLSISYTRRKYIENLVKGWEQWNSAHLTSSVSLESTVRVLIKLGKMEQESFLLPIVFLKKYAENNNET